MDRLTPEARSRNMSRIRAKDTGPELAVRRFLHADGLRFRLHGKGLPGTPDIVFRRRGAVIFVHGCFWHGCPNCGVGRRQVKSNVGYWSGKVAKNRERDVRNQAALEAAGWTVLTIWACQAKTSTHLASLAAAIRSLPQTSAFRCL